MTTALRRWRARTGDDERGSLVIVMLLVLFMSIVVLTISTSAFGQLDLANSSSAKNDYLQGALSGIQAAVGQIRAANTSGYVNPTSLPCSSETGSIPGSETPSYSYSIQYYVESPSGSSVAISCTPGSGPQITVAGDYLSSAVVTSCAPANDCPTSTTSAGNSLWRRVVSTYTFETTNVNTPGGVIYSYENATTGLQDCLLAVLQNPSNPAAGVSLDVTNSCKSGNSQYSLEQFQYTSTWNLAIDLDDTEYCIQDSEDLSSPQGSTVALVACSGNTTNATDQWGVNDSAGIEGVATTGSPSGQPNGWCLDNPIGGVSSASTITEAATIGSCSTLQANGFSPNASWQMSPTVGAGGATTSGTGLIGQTDQMINYEQFGLCMDVTNQDVSWPYLIDYDCKQFPDTTDYPVWNQRWCFQKLATTNGNEVGLLYTPYGQTSCTGATNPYCMQSPGTTATQNSTAYVTVVSCSITGSLSSYASDLVWTAWGSNGGSSNDYTWTDYNGDCLESNPTNAQNPGGSTYWSVLQVDTCSGSYYQKWDAPPTLGVSQVSNTHEGTGTTWSVGNP